jgi:asparagine synthase (glutamine-hydrolysing)
LSAIAGAVLSAPSPGVGGLAEAMLARMAHRAPDGSAAWHEAHVAFGLGLLRSLPEDPEAATVLEDGDLVLVADVRLDNRDELLASLPDSDAGASDAQLVLLGYRLWGDDCPSRLLGDFAFAVFDRSARRLFAARDHLGVKPFYYRAEAAGFAFASEPKALFAPGAPFPPIALKDIDEARVVDHLRATVTDAHATFYSAIRRLPAGHKLGLVAGGAPVVSRYWELQAGRRTAGDTAATFRSLFREAVRCRLRSPAPAAVMLSGGLDSSSIACVASDLRKAESGPPVDSFSMVFDETPEWNERPFIEVPLRAGMFSPRFIPADRYAPFDGFDRLLAEQDAVFAAPGLAVGRGLSERVAAEGFRVLLSGHGGDEVVSHGMGRLRELAEGGRWRTLWREAHGVAALYGEPGWRIFAKGVLYHGRFRGAHRLRRLVARLPSAPSDKAGLVNRALLDRTDAGRRRQATPAASRPFTEQADHLAILRSPLQAYGLEVLDLATAAVGVETRYPFLDKRLVEFCLSLPAEEKLDGGWTRLILRRAMEGILPPAIQWRRDKLDFSPHIIGGMLAHHRALIDEIVEHDVDGVGAYAHMPAVRAAYRRMKAAGQRASGGDAQAVWRTVALSLWLRQIRQPSAGGMAS